MKTAANGQTIRLDINSDYDAAALDTLLHQLALARAEMTPPIPTSRGNAIQSDSMVTVEDGSSAVIARRRGGGFRLWLRHSGFGWLAWEIDDLFARGMADYIATNTAGTESINLVKDEGSNWH